jgi:hypothetical protein
MWLELKAGTLWLERARNYKVPTPMILDGLHRTKVIKERGKDIVLTKKPKRPSKRIEVLTVEEANILRRMERPFDEYKEFLSNLGKEVAISDIRSVREKISRLIQAMWLVVEKVTAPLTKRRTALVAHMNENERKKVNINKNFIQSYINNQFADCKDDAARLYTLSPIPLFLKCGSQQEITSAAKCEIKIQFFVVPDNIDTAVIECMIAFSKITNVEMVTARPQRKKNRGPTQVEEFDDMEGAPTFVKGKGSPKEPT